MHSLQVYISHQNVQRNQSTLPGQGTLSHWELTIQPVNNCFAKSLHNQWRNMEFYNKYIGRHVCNQKFKLCMGLSHWLHIKMDNMTAPQKWSQYRLDHPLLAGWSKVINPVPLPVRRWDIGQSTTYKYMSKIVFLNVVFVILDCSHHIDILFKATYLL